MAVMVAVPVVAPGLKVTVAYPVLLVTTVAWEMLPSEVVNLTVSPVSGLVLSMTCAVTVDVMVEFAAMVSGATMSVRVPADTVTVAVWVRVPQTAVMVASPATAPGVNVTTA